jgi:hypothetical protein
MAEVESSSLRGVPSWAVSIGVFVVFAVVFATTAVWQESEVNVDAVASALPAWSLAAHGTIDLPAGAMANPWVIEGPDGNFSNRPPGTFLVAVPAYLIAGGSRTFSNAPATATSVMLTAAAMAVLFLTLSRIVPAQAALFAVVVFGFGTATWPISSAQLWPHGTGQLAAAIGVFGLATGRYVVGGLGFAGGLAVRPPTALFSAVTGLWVSADAPDRKWRPVLAIGLTSLASLTLLMLYNKVVFGRLGISGGYSPRLAESFATMSWGDYARNLLAMFALPKNGFLVWSPVILVAHFALFESWRRAPAWARASWVAGLLYLLVHARLNRASGGLAFNYRYPLEPLVMMAPLLTVGAVEWVRRTGTTRRLVVAGCLLSVFLQALYVFTLTCEPTGPGEALCTLGG